MSAPTSSSIGTVVSWLLVVTCTCADITTQSLCILGHRRYDDCCYFVTMIYEDAFCVLFAFVITSAAFWQCRRRHYVFRLFHCPFRSFVLSDIVTTIFVNGSNNIDKTTDEQNRCWRSKVKVTPWFKYALTKASMSMLGCRSASSSCLVAQ